MRIISHIGEASQRWCAVLAPQKQHQLAVPIRQGALTVRVQHHLASSQIFILKSERPRPPAHTSKKGARQTLLVGDEQQPYGIATIRQERQ